MRQFENHVKELKFKVLKSIARAMFEESDMAVTVLNTPKEIIPGPKATMRCCIYKERAIVEERMLMGLGGHKQNTNILEAIPIACDECPLGGYEVTDHCRGCISKNCLHTCRRGAIKINEVTHKAFIDKEKCVNCGLCASACNYNAIMNFTRPCEKACVMHAIEKGESGEAVINDAKCIGCGQCISITDEKVFEFEVLKLDKSNFCKLVHSLNIYSISVTFEVSQFDIFTDVKALSPQKKLFKRKVTFENKRNFFSLCFLFNACFNLLFLCF